MQVESTNVLSVGLSGFKTSKLAKGMSREIAIGCRYRDHCILLNRTI